MEKIIASTIRDHYSAAGVEVEGLGDRRVRVRMPPEFADVTNFCGHMQEEYGAHVDLVVDDNDQKCVVFEVCVPKMSLHTNSSPPPVEEAVSETPWWATVVQAVVPVAGAFATYYVFNAARLAQSPQPA